MTTKLKQAIEILQTTELQWPLHVFAAMHAVIAAAERCEKLEAQREELREYLEIFALTERASVSAQYNKAFKDILDKLNEQEGVKDDQQHKES